MEKSIFDIKGFHFVDSLQFCTAIASVLLVFFILLFNIIIWFTELICGTVVFIPGSQYILLFYIVTPNIISPIIYYIGMESNRKELKKYFLELFKESKDNAKAAKTK